VNSSPIDGSVVLGNVMNKRYMEKKTYIDIYMLRKDLANKSRKALIAANEQSPTHKEQKLYSSKTYDE
jgi:hypothetical protein